MMHTKPLKPFIPLKHSPATLAVMVAALLFAANANAQYYGGVSLNGAQDSRNQFLPNQAFGFNGGERPSELLSFGNLASKPIGINFAGESSLGIKLGYRFTPYFSVEGRLTERTGASLSNTLFRSELSAPRTRETSMGLDLVGTLPVMKNLSLQGRAGLRNDSTQSVFAGSTQSTQLSSPRIFSVSTPTTAGLAGALGLGVQYNFNTSLGLRFEVERSRKFFHDRFAGEADSANSVSFGVLWRF
jgi:opacity protein-like surface antigen